MKAKFEVEVDFNPEITDAESVASGLDILLETAMSTPDILDEYGNPTVGEFYCVADPCGDAERRKQRVKIREAKRIARSEAFSDALLALGISFKRDYTEFDSNDERMVLGALEKIRIAFDMLRDLGEKR